MPSTCVLWVVSRGGTSPLVDNSPWSPSGTGGFRIRPPPRGTTSRVGTTFVIAKTLPTRETPSQLTKCLLSTRECYLATVVQIKAQADIPSDLCRRKHWCHTFASVSDSSPGTISRQCSIPSTWTQIITNTTSRILRGLHLDSAPQN